MKHKLFKNKLERAKQSLSDEPLTVNNKKKLKRIVKDVLVKDSAVDKRTENERKDVDENNKRKDENAKIFGGEVTTALVPYASQGDLSKIGTVYNGLLGKPAGLGKKYEEFRLACDSCYAMSSCPKFEPGCLCKFKDWGVEVANGVEGYVGKFEGLIKVAETRLTRALYFELQDGGVLDPDISEELERLFTRYKEIIELNELLKPNGAPNAPKSDLLSRIFSGVDDDDDDETETEVSIKKNKKKIKMGKKGKVITAQYSEDGD